MQVNYTSLVNFISGEKIFSIPVYQRNIGWNKEHCSQLFKDIENLADSVDTSHFIGTFIYQKESENSVNHIVVDGQQRLAAIILIAKAIHDSSSDEKLRNSIRSVFINNSIEDMEYSFKLLLSEYDSEIFKKLMSGEELNEQEKSSRIYENYEFFRAAIAASRHNNNLAGLRKAISRLHIVAMGLDKENAQKIFESLNSTGLELTEAELIRNYLLMDLNYDAQSSLYKEYWLPIERLFNSPKIVEIFMLQYLIARRKSITDMQDDKNIHISRNKLYETFKKYFRNNYGEDDKQAHVEEFLKDMYRYAKFYARFLFDENTKLGELPELDKKFYELVYLLGASSSPIVLLYLYDKFDRQNFDETTFKGFVDALISLMFRAKVCRMTGADTAQTAGNILMRLEKAGTLNLDSFWKAITSGKGKYTFPSDEDFQNELTRNDIYSTGKECKYFLYALELRRTTNLPRYYDTCISCVMPRNLNAVWKKYLSNRKDSDAEFWANSLGNLVLATSDKNKTAAFADKRVAFATSEFSYTAEVSQNSDWTSNQIQARLRKLANLALKIWTLPAKYNATVTANKNNFTLDEDFSRFTNTSPASVSISGKEVQCNSWIGILRMVAKAFYALDREKFKQAVQNSERSNLFSTSKGNLKAPVDIGENYYIGSGLDTKSCLRIARDIVENFDRLGGTNFKEEIWFTLSEEK